MSVSGVVLLLVEPLVINTRICITVKTPQEHRADLPTHPLFSGDTWILQGSPGHPRRMARDTVGAGGRVNRCSVFSELAHVTLIKIS